MNAPDIPHVDITGVIVDGHNEAEIVQDWKSKLRTALMRQNPFKLQFGEPIKMQAHESLPDNVSFPVPVKNSEFQPLCDLIIEITHEFFPGTTKRGLTSQTDHMCIVENVPDHLKVRVASEVARYMPSVVFDVDKVWMVTIEENHLTREPYFFATRSEVEDVYAYVPDDSAAQWLLATMFIHEKPFDSRLRFQKVIFLENPNMAMKYFGFKRDRYGPYSHHLKDSCDSLKSQRLVYETTDYEIGLTPVGKKVAAACYSLLEPDERFQIVRWMKDNAAKTTDELLTFVHFEHPDYHAERQHWTDD